MKLVSKYKIGPIFTPPVVSKADGPLATIVSPGATGGANWPGGSYDPETHTVYVFSQTAIALLGLVPSPDANVVGHGLRPGHGRRCARGRASRWARLRPRRQQAGDAACAGGGEGGGPV